MQVDPISWLRRPRRTGHAGVIVSQAPDSPSRPCYRISPPTKNRCASACERPKMDQHRDLDRLQVLNVPIESLYTWVDVLQMRVRALLLAVEAFDARPSAPLPCGPAAARHVRNVTRRQGHPQLRGAFEHCCSRSSQHEVKSPRGLQPVVTRRDRANSRASSGGEPPLPQSLDRPRSKKPPPAGTAGEKHAGIQALLRAVQS